MEDQGIVNSHKANSLDQEVGIKARKTEPTSFVSVSLSVDQSPPPPPVPP